MPQKPDIATILKVVARELRETQNRVAALERRNRRLMILQGVVFFGLLFLGFAVFSPYKTITASQFVVHGNGEGDRIIVGLSAITLFDSKLTMRARLGIGVAGQPEITLYDEKQKVRSSLGEFENGSPRILFYDEKETNRASLGLNSEGIMTIQIHDAGGKKIQVYELNPKIDIEGVPAGSILNATS